MTGTKYAAAHLDLRLTVLNRACRAAVRRQQAEAALLDRPDLADRCITDRQVAVLLDRADRFVTDAGCPAAHESDGDMAVEDELRDLAREAGAALPLDVLTSRFGLDELDRQALVAVAAPELDRAYERIYAYVCDEFDRRYPSVELLLTLTGGLCDRYPQRAALGPFGTLRRCRLLLPYADAATDLRQQLRLAPGLLDLLLGAPLDPGAVAGDPDSVAGDPDAAGTMADAFPVRCRPALPRVAAALREGTLDTVLIHAEPVAFAEAAATELARAAGMPLRRVSALSGAGPDQADAGQAGAGRADAIQAGAIQGGAVQAGAILRRALAAAGACRALLWISLPHLADDLQDVLAAVLAGTHQPIVLTAAQPWRPAAAMAGRRWLEVHADDDAAARAAYWQQRFPGLADGHVRELAGRSRLAPLAATAAAGLAATAATVLGEDDDRALEAACTAMSAPRPDRLVRVVTPQRGPDHLVLTAPLHRQILEIASFARALPDQHERWRGNRLMAGHRGYKALFTGDPGTGKTLAAEVIAVQLGTPLVKVDLSRVVSKWVGETAKHLDDVFTTIGGSGAVLFFDEADSLFGRRGEVRHGTDRYANTEVSHLLQRFEEYAGVVILASNLSDNIDPAFVRRFHTVVHFPRPDEPERRRLWELALHPCDAGVDLDRLAALELTGAGIVGAVRTASLLAAASGADRPSMRDVAQGVSRQFRSEGRLLGAGDLGPYADRPDPRR
ncbi:ATP-binding protein [Actinoplanes sp. NPDC023714]|uniref:ATP-binding protein n=1 Tax=Actinoplanes sp. NPDC023714 TaxID=3154322 RepID=UPI00340270BB